MEVIHAVNVNDALAKCLVSLVQVGERRESRNGPVLGFPGPVATSYARPNQRVLFSPMRNANPTFHLLESLWMLAGRNDLKFPATFVKNMKSFSDNGRTLHGAYGYRWRQHFGYDQLDWIADELQANPESRRMVLQMWDAGSNAEEKELKNDLYVANHGGLDVPCNTSIYFDCRGGKLNMLVSCRSNDIIWGCYGANAVHMSVLQEYMAAKIGIPMGVYTQMSNDLHLYESKMPKGGLTAFHRDICDYNLYSDKNTQNVILGTMPLIAPGESVKDFDEDLEEMFSAFDTGGVHAMVSVNYETRFFQQVVSPMTQAWLFRKTPVVAKEHAGRIRAQDWWWAMNQWLLTNHISFGAL